MDERASQGPDPADGFADDLDVFNYFLTLEQLGHALYRDGLNSFTAEQFISAGFDQPVIRTLVTFSDQDLAHIQTVTAAVSTLGGVPVTEIRYDFGAAFREPIIFLETVQAMANTMVAAYGGAEPAIRDPHLRMTAGSIAAEERLQAAYLNGLTGAPPAPRSSAAPLPRERVLQIVGPFLLA
jgi:hypothetical protein